SLQWAMVIDRSSLRPCPACRGALPGKERPGRRAMEREWRAAGPGAGSEIDLDAGAHRPAVEFLLAEQAGATDIGAVRRIVHVGALQEHADLRAEGIAQLQVPLVEGIDVNVAGGVFLVRFEQLRGAIDIGQAGRESALLVTELGRRHPVRLRQQRYRVAAVGQAGRFGPGEGDVAAQAEAVARRGQVASDRVKARVPPTLRPSKGACRKLNSYCALSSRPLRVALSALVQVPTSALTRSMPPKLPSCPVRVVS